MEEKFLTEKEIKEELNDYIYNVSIKYATLLNGSWGSGKTYFVKECIKEFEKEYEDNKKSTDKRFKKPIYISLYGLSSISEIKNKISLSLIKNDKVKQLMPFLDVGLEIGSEFVSKNTFIQNSDNKLNKIIGALYKINNLIIFFDDLERCNISINSILGYINELVEHNDIKVVIVADENKIGKLNYESNLELKYIVALSDRIKIEGKKDNKNLQKTIGNSNVSDEITKDEIMEKSKYIFGEDNLYSEVKEKLIGKVIYYRANVDTIYDTFVEEIITNIDAKNTAMKNKEMFLKQLEENRHYNLRTVQFILQSFNRLVLETLNITDFDGVKDIYLKDLFSYCIIKSLHIKQGKNSYNWEKGQEFGTIYLGNQLLDYIYKNFVVGFKFVDDYLLNSYLAKNNLKTILNNYKKMVLNEMNNPSDPLYKLKKWWIVPEKDLELIIDELIQKIKNNEYELELYSKIVNFLSRIEEMNVCKAKIKLAINELEKNIESGNVKGEYSEDRLFDGTPKTAELYKKNIDKIRLLLNDKEKNYIQSTLDSIFNSDDWGQKLKGYCELNSSKFLAEKRFIYIFNVDLILKNIRTKSIEEIYEFWYALQKIYNFSNIKDYYENDKIKLVEFKKKLESIKRIDNVKKFVVNKIVLFLENVISNL